MCFPSPAISWCALQPVCTHSNLCDVQGLPGRQVLSAVYCRAYVLQEQQVMVMLPKLLLLLEGSTVMQSGGCPEELIDDTAAV